MRKSMPIKKNELLAILENELKVKFSLSLNSHKMKYVYVHDGGGMNADFLRYGNGLKEEFKIQMKSLINDDIIVVEFEGRLETMKENFFLHSKRPSFFTNKNTLQSRYKTNLELNSFQELHGDLNAMIGVFIRLDCCGGFCHVKFLVEENMDIKKSMNLAFRIVEILVKRGDSS